MRSEEGALRPARTELAVFATFAVLHLPGLAVAAAHPAWAPLGSVLASAVLWTALALLALRGLRRRHVGHQDGGVSRGLLAAALALDVVVLVVSGLSPPRPGNLLAAGIGMIALCAASALLTRPRHVPLVLVPALVGQAVLVRAADTAADTARYVADTVTVVAATAATSIVIVWLERARRAGVRALAEAAVTDPLTGLLNRRGMEQRFEALHRVARLRGERVGVVVVDVDHFKAVNDRHGHDAGDAVLVAVAGALRSCARGDDLLVRLGGEELAWVCARPASERRTEAAERLRAEVAGATSRAGRPVTVSAGVAHLPLHGDDGRADSTDGPDSADSAHSTDSAAVLSRLLVAADRALYSAKAGGRDRVEVHAG